MLKNKGMSKAASLHKVIPDNARPFILKGLALVIGWNLLYKLWLGPIGIPDAQLTSAVQYGTAKLLDLFIKATWVGNSVYINGVESVTIAPQCNGLELMVLYIGFILCIPTNWRRMLLFSLAGSVVIYILNVIRCAVLAEMFYTHHYLTDFAHHYAFKLAIYGVVFYGWVLYAKNAFRNAA
ncbi:MAG: hypothetical protein BGO70_16935 [Bacteroidetes bacterium 43-93]|nr:MAG: hypothetical protein BGO70_16935 [Bacteroidetes bacterium 43-93]